MISKQAYDIKFFKWVQQEVAKFNMIAGKTPEELTGDSQLALCKEEMDELAAAWHSADLVCMLKEAVDCLVVGSPLVAIHTLCSQPDINTAVDYIRNNPHPMDAFWVGTTVVRDLPVDYREAVKEVLQSNLSKFSIYQTLLEGDYDKHCHTLMEDGRYSDVTWQVTVYEGIHFVVWKDSNGKCMKGLDYFKADVSQYVWEEL